jgi:multiple sugar transport system substrate-binding protein
MLCIHCSRQSTSPVTLAVGGAPSEIDFWEQLIETFSAEYGTTVELIRQPTDTDQRRQGLVIPLNAKKSDPDVFLMDVAWIAQFAASQWLYPLDSLMKSSTLTPELFFQSVIRKADRYQDALIALPVYIDGGMLYYRTDLLQEYCDGAVPRTWQQLVQCAKTVQDAQRKTVPDFYGFVWQGAQYEGLVCTFLEFAGSNGGGIMDNNGDIRISRAENKTAVEFMHNCIYEHAISPPSTYTEMKEEEVRIYFQQGKAMFERNWPYAWALHNSDESPVKGKVGIAPLPYFPGGKSGSTLGGWHIGVSRYTDAVEQSWELVKFIVSYTTQKKLARKLGWNPGRVAVYSDSTILAELPHFASLKTVFEHARPRPIVPYYTQISEVLQRQINSVLAGKTAAEDALKNAEEEAMQVIKRYQQ